MLKLLVNLLLAAAAVGTSACAPYRAVPQHLPPGSLVSSLNVETARDSVRFVYQVTNAAGAPVALTFPSGQSFDLVVEGGGRELWLWSADRMFTQAVRTETLAPGETRTYTAAWSPPAGVSGELAARAFLTAREHRAEQPASFRLP